MSTPRAFPHFQPQQQHGVSAICGPTEEVSFAPGGTGLGSFPQSETIPLSSSFTLTLPKIFFFLHPGSTPLHTFAA